MEALEKALGCGAPLHGDSEILRSLRERALALWKLHAHVILRHLPLCTQGGTGLLTAALLVKKFVFYGEERVARHFRMSPWTKSLSHTLAAGSFHTDFNTAVSPPGTTAIQCLEADPGAPQYGQLRVARFEQVMARLATSAPETARFVQCEEVTMLSESAPAGWRGKIFADGIVRFHPEGLRAGRKMLGKNSPSLEVHLAQVTAAAVHVSTPFHLDAGDLLLVSNRRALHQRDACTVRFTEFPMRFEARRVSVFHAIDEPA
jgi:hypothetical protein